MLYHEKDLTTLALFHFKNKYILAPVKSGLMVIDQKRAHERIVYERFIQFEEHNTGYTQQNLFPQSLELNPADYTLLKEIMKDLNHLGFDIGDLGNNSIIINGFPTNSKIDDPMEIIEVLLETYKATQTDLKKNHSEKIALSLSTASAIPYGKQLNREEMSNLVNNLFACSSPNYSPSGKPVFTIIDLDVFENMLK